MSAQLTKLMESSALLLTGSLLAIASTGALIVLLISLPLSALEQAMAVVTGAGLQASMYLLSRFKGVARVVSILLLIVSIAASTAFIESAWQRHITALNQSQLIIKADSDVVRALQQERENVQQQIDIRTAAAAKDTAGKYTTRGFKRLDDVEKYQTRIKQINEEIMQVKQTTTATGADRGSVQALMVDVDSRTRIAAFALISALIDIAAILLFARVNVSVFRSLASDRVSRGQPFNAVMQRTDSVTVSRTDAVMMQTDGVNQIHAEKFGDSRYQEHLKERILAGEFGLPISQRKAIDEVKSVFDQLISAGKIQKAAKGFQLC